MSIQGDRIPKVIPIDVTDDEFGDDEEDEGIQIAKYSADRSSNIMQRIAGVVKQFTFDSRSSSPSASSAASNSDDNALFESEQEEEEEEEHQVEGLDKVDKAEPEAEQAVVVSSLQPPQETPDETELVQSEATEAPATSPVQVNNYIEQLLETCISLIKTTKESKANADADNWAIKHGCGFYMSNRFHCYYNQRHGCKASFETNDRLVEHLSSVHSLSEETISRSIQQAARDKKLAHWIIAAKLPINTVIDGQFDIFLGALHDQEGNRYSVSHSRLEKIIKAEHEIISTELSERLKAIQHISVVISLWERAGHPSILLFSVFSIDQDWNKKSYIIAAEPLAGHDIRTAILQKIVIVFMDLNILYRVYSITCQGITQISAATLFTFIQKIIGSTGMKLTRDRIYTTMLDQVVMEMRIELLSSLRFDCEPLKTVIDEMDSCKCNVFFKEMQPYSIKLMRAYLDNRRNHHIDCGIKSYSISDADEECMGQIIKMDYELAFIYDWLYEAAEKNITIANKAYVICCELGKSIKALAELRSSRRFVTKTSTSKNYEIADAVTKADYMKKPLEAMHKLLSAYRTQIENGRGHVEAFVYDSYAYNDSYFRLHNKTPTLLKQLKDITVLLEDIAEQEGRRYRANDITELLKINTEEKQQFEDPDVATSSSCNIISGKRRRSNKSTVIQEPQPSQPFTEQIQLLQQKQIAYFKRYPDTKIKDQPKIMTILSEQATGGQINFWRQESDERLSVLIGHTKKAFAIPTTTQECINSVDQFKKFYLQLADQEQNDNVDFICKRALLSCWSMDFTIFKN